MNRVLFRALFTLTCVTLAAQAGCSSSPPPRTSYEDPITSIRLYVDERAGAGHSHPARIAADQLAHALGGLRIIPRTGFIGSLISGDPQGVPAFTSAEIRVLAPKLSRALADARPNELVTFYRRISDPGAGLAITSGGLFVEGTHLFMILANDRTLPTDGMNQNMVSDFDPVDSPLIPISRTSFHVEFTPAAAVVPDHRRAPWPYIDEGRILAIDLRQLDRHMKSPQPAVGR